MNPVATMAFLILAILVVASATLAILARARPGLDLGEVRARVRSWWTMASVFFAALALHDLVSLAFFALVSFLALREYLRLLPASPAPRRALVLAALAVAGQYWFAATGWYGMFVLFVPLYVFLALPLRLVARGETAGFIAATAEVQWGLLAFVFGLSHLALLLVLPLPPTGRALLLFLVFVVEASDVLQFLWGRALGRRRILPAVSPNKTWEGAIGGIASVCLLSLGLRFLTPFSPLETAGVALLVAVAGFAGGAVMSAFKRDVGVKDFGTIIPGHGGVIDRVDSLCWAAPLFLHYVRYFHG